MVTSLSRLDRRSVLGLTGAALAWPVIGRASPLDTMTGAAFGTGWSLSGRSDARLDPLRPALDQLFAEIDRQMSPWRPDSAISTVNAAAPGVHRLPDQMATVTRAALDLAASSDGAFDPTVGPLVARWGFGPITGSDTCDWRDLTVDGADLTTFHAGVTLDLCGIAKGWALDRSLDMARQDGHDQLLMDLGGELRAIGTHPDGRPWQVAVEDPLGSMTPPAILQLADGMAVATSGLRTQSYRLGDRDYGHIIDPATDSPATGRLRSVSVIAPEAMIADGWATALFAAGEIRGPELARRHGIAALFLVEENEALRQVRTGTIGEVVL